jgi:serine/threonine protein kinase
MNSGFRPSYPSIAATPLAGLSTGQRSSAPKITTVSGPAQGMIGRVLGDDFEITGLIGQGSHADVFSAVQYSVGKRPVAIKLQSHLYLSLAEQDLLKAGHALLREAELLGGLAAPCFVDVYRTGQLQDRRAWMAMELAQGKPLAQRMVENRLTPQLIGDAMHQWAAGLAEMHRRSWVHRDVTPANAMLSVTILGTQQLMTYDLGTATPIRSGPDRLRNGYDRDRPTGTAAYMSPEQAQGNAVDARADQFALAVISWELLTGRRPFDPDVRSTAGILDYLRSNRPIPQHGLHSLRPDLPGETGSVLSRALDRDPERRYSDVLSFADALRDSLAEAPAGNTDGMPKTGSSSLLSRLFGRGEAK